jgi:NDP-sugar pyrophosphorylase family protein
MEFNSSQIVAVILAGGYGTRVQHLLPGVPKPMASVAGKPFLEWIIHYLKVQGITKVIISTGYLAEIIEEYFRDRPISGVEISCYRETTPLGTAGGFLNAVRQSEQKPLSWLIINGDSLVFTNLNLLNIHLDDLDIGGVILGLEVGDTSRYGSLIYNEKDILVGFQEKRPGIGIINAGVYLLRHSLLREFPQNLPLSFEKDVFPNLLNKGINLKVQTVATPFLDIGTPESLPQAEKFIQNNLDKFDRAY